MAATSQPLLDNVRISRLTRVELPVDTAELARGPGKLAQAMEITLGLDGIDLTQGGPLWLGRIDRTAGDIGVSVRIGITKETHLPLRFFERGSKFVSGPKHLNLR